MSALYYSVNGLNFNTDRSSSLLNYGNLQLK